MSLKGLKDWNWSVHYVNLSLKKDFFRLDFTTFECFAYLVMRNRKRIQHQSIFQRVESMFSNLTSCLFFVLIFQSSSYLKNVQIRLLFHHFSFTCNSCMRSILSSLVILKILFDQNVKYTGTYIVVYVWNCSMFFSKRLSDLDRKPTFF